jgi:hypothetical protein
MRNHLDHTMPADTQDVPADNTSAYVMAQAAQWQRTGQLVHSEVALEIASWFASSGAWGASFAAFATSGTITDELMSEIDHEIGCLMGVTDSEVSASDVADEIEELSALRAYVSACTVTVFTVMHNMPGYMPEGDPVHTLDARGALSTWRENVRADNDEINTGDREWLDVDTAISLVTSAEVENHGASVTVGMYVYTVTSAEMTYGEFCESLDN